MIRFFRNRKLKWKKISNDTNDWLMIMEARDDNEIFVLINLYNSNTEVKDENAVET